MSPRHTGVKTNRGPVVSPPSRAFQTGSNMNAPARAHTIDPLLYPRDVAALLGVSTSWLAKARLTGAGPRFVKVGRAVRYLESCVKEYIKARTRGSTGEE